MPGLKILDLSYTWTHKLFQSVTVLENLTALILKYCFDLTEVPSLEKRGALEVLNLYGCGKLKEVPRGIECLSKLRFLNLVCTGIKELPAGILCKLSQLQLLAFGSRHHTSRLRGEELRCLSKLECLICLFPDAEDFRTSLSTTNWKKLSQCLHYLGVGEYSYEDQGICVLFEEAYRGIAYFRKCEISRDLLDILPTDIKQLELHHVSVCMDDGRGLLSLKNALQLKSLEIHSCSDEIESLFSLPPSQCISDSLEIVELEDVVKLRALFCREGEGGDAVPLPTGRFPPIGTFSRLKQFTAWGCKSMKKLFPLGLLPSLQNLQELTVRFCFEMEEIIEAEEEEGGTPIVAVLLQPNSISQV